MQLLRVGCLALGLVPLAAPVLAQDTVQLFAPAPKAPPAPSAQTIPVVRAALTEAPPVPLPRPTPEINRRSRLDGGQGRQQIAHRTGPFVFESHVLRGGPAHRVDVISHVQVALRCVALMPKLWQSWAATSWCQVATLMVLGGNLKVRVATLW